jgi:hypothetical protein
VPQQSANGAPDPKAGRVGSVRLGRRVGETSGVDMDEIRSGTRARAHRARSCHAFDGGYRETAQGHMAVRA